MYCNVNDVSVIQGTINTVNLQSAHTTLTVKCQNGCNQMCKENATDISWGVGEYCFQVCDFVHAPFV